MVFDSFLLMHAAQVAEQAVTHLATTASTLHHDAHVFLEEISKVQLNPDLIRLGGGVDGGCHADLL
ncbi:hypothetical protein [Krasilnikovia sp. MM14-A1259]|uniref:hypothetical protein n=1 Tax=Krasilnikovia sp. MM14-A1259 TaxID=3373539 RepID=UPI00381005C0